MDRRLILPILAISLLIASGCAQQVQAPSAPASSNQTTATNQPSPPSQPAVPAQTTGNITENPAPPPGALANVTNMTGPSGTNASQNPPENPANTTPGNGTNYTANPPPGLNFPESNYTLVLDDVSLIPDSQGPCGIFSIRDANGSIIDKMLICPPESQDWVAPDGHLYRIRVEKVAAGYSTQENWAQVSIFG